MTAPSKVLNLEPESELVWLRDQVVNPTYPPAVARKAGARLVAHEAALRAELDAMRAEREGLIEALRGLLPYAESRAEDLVDILEGSFGGVDRDAADRAWAALRKARDAIAKARGDMSAAAEGVKDG